jgi:hypothetical protein
VGNLILDKVGCVPIFRLKNTFFGKICHTNKMDRKILVTPPEEEGKHLAVATFEASRQINPQPPRCNAC